MSHDHAHHSHSTADFTGAFAIGVFLNVAYVIAQIIGGIAAHSLALLADAGHNFGDVLGLLVAWSTVYLSKTRATAPDIRRQYSVSSVNCLRPAVVSA